MRPIGYHDWNWESEGFKAGLPSGWMPFPSIEPVILPRAGTLPTFGPSEIGALTIPVTFITTPENELVTGTSFEEAFRYLFKRLNPYDTNPRELRMQYGGPLGDGNGDVVTTQAVIRLMSNSGGSKVNERKLDFVSVGLFSDQEESTASGTFS